MANSRQKEEVAKTWMNMTNISSPTVDCERIMWRLGQGWNELQLSWREDCYVAQGVHSWAHEENKMERGIGRDRKEELLWCVKDKCGLML